MQCEFAYRNPSVLVKKKRYHAVFHKKAYRSYRE